MVTPSKAPAVAAPGKPSPGTYAGVVLALVLFAVACGFMAALKPSGVWQQPFSWHPLLMTVGMVSFTGVGAMTKKLGGYDNTKMHAILSWSGVFCAMGGLYAIYRNKEILGRQHLTSWHSLFGIATFLSCVGLGLAGSIVLHPDFGIDKTNKTIRFAHKTGARVTLFFAWIAALSGLYTVTQDAAPLMMYGIPLLVFVPLILM